MAAKSTSEKTTGSGCIAIEIAISSMRIAEIQRAHGTGTPQVVKRGYATLDESVWTDTLSAVPKLTRALKEAIQVSGISARDVVICLPRRFATLRRIRLPHAPVEALRGMLTFEAGQYLLYPVEEVVLGYQVVGNSSADDMDTVLLAAARKDMVNVILQACDAVKLNVKQISLSSIALVNLLGKEEPPIALFSVENGALDMVVSSEGKTLFSRAVDLRGAEDQDALLATEISRSLTAFQNEWRPSQFPQCYLTGSSLVRETGIPERISSLLGMDVRLFNSDTITLSDPELQSYATAAGMAIQGLKVSQTQINLIPEERYALRKQSAKTRNIIIGSTLGLVALLAFGDYLQHVYDNDAAYRQRQQAANATWKGFEPRLKKREDEAAKVEELADAVKDGLDRAHPMVGILLALSNSMPSSPDIWLTDLSLQRGQNFTIRGRAMSALLATQLVEKLRQSPDFKAVRLTFLGDEHLSVPLVQKPAVLPGMSNNPPVTSTPAGPMGFHGPTMGFPGHPGAPMTQPGAVVISPNGAIHRPAGSFPPNGAQGFRSFRGGPNFRGGASQGTMVPTQLSPPPPPPPSMPSGAQASVIAPPANSVTGFVITCSLNGPSVPAESGSTQ